MREQPPVPERAGGEDATPPVPPPVPTQASASGPPPVPAPDPLPSPNRLTDPARLHATEASRTYPCQACGASMVFDVGSGRLRCSFCQSVRDVEVEAGRPQRHDLVSTMQALHAAGPHAQQPDQLSREVTCQSCGGTTAFDGTTTATRCPFCTTPIQRDDFHDAPERLPIDGIVPFQVDETTARVELEGWINSRRFAPKEFKRYRELGSFTSIYLTYFNFFAQTTTQYVGQRGERYVERRGMGDNATSETKVRWSPAAGTVYNTFAELPELANTGLDRARIQELEPWPMNRTKRYSPQYVAGHLARTYDEDAQQRFERGARPRIEREIARSIKEDIGGDEQRILSTNAVYTLLEFSHLLLPVWLLTVTFDGKPFQVFINGVTGEVQGHRPWSMPKIAATVAAAVLLLAVLVGLFFLR